MTLQSRHDAVSGQVQPIRYRTNPPSASVPERGIGTTATFTLQVIEFHTSYTPALCRRSRAVYGRKAPTPPPKRLGRASMLKLQRTGAVCTNALLAQRLCIIATFYSDMLNFTRHIQKGHQKFQRIPSYSSFNTTSK
jgi:hypothetical protein